jgi:hypothetical protein
MSRRPAIERRKLSTDNHMDDQDEFIAELNQALAATPMPSELASPESTGPLPVVGSGGVVVLRSSSASALLESIEELRRHMHEPHGGGGYPCEDTVSREKKMMFHHANKALDAAIAEVRRQMESTNVRQPQDNT